MLWMHSRKGIALCSCQDLERDIRGALRGLVDANSVQVRNPVRPGNDTKGNIVSLFQ